MIRHMRNAGLGALFSAAITAGVIDVAHAHGPIEYGIDYASARKHLLEDGFRPSGMAKSLCVEWTHGRNQICEWYSEAYRCYGTGSAGCEFIFFDKPGGLFIVRTIGQETKDEDSKREVGLDLKVVEARYATPQERNEVLERISNASKTPPEPEDSNKLNVNRMAFFGTTEWVLIQKMARDKSNLIFRRYSILVDNPEGDTEFDPKKFNLNVLDMASLINHQFYYCRRDRRDTDHLTIHLPDYAELRSFDLKSWQSKLNIRVLADGQSRSLRSEYIKGDFFFDLRAMTVDDFGSLLTASRVIFEFGDKADRIHHLTTDVFGGFNLRAFMRQAIPHVFKLAPQTYRYFDTTEMVTSCNRYKQTGVLPSFK